MFRASELVDVLRFDAAIGDSDQRFDDYTPPKTRTGERAAVYVRVKDPQTGEPIYVLKKVQTPVQ